MSSSKRTAFASYVRQLADQFGLKDWAIEVPETPPDGTAIAATWMAYGQRLARIHLSDKFLCDTPEDQRDTIVHELLHLHFAAMDGLVTDWLEADKHKAYSRMFEYGIDAIAIAVSPRLPLPGSKPKESSR